MSDPAPEVLVVDDDDSIRQFIEMALHDDGYAVSGASDGAAALEMIRQRAPRLILLDMRMPGMDGWSFASAYRSLPRPHAPIVVLTAARDASGWAAQIQADAYLAKPFDLGELLALVARFTGRG